MPVPIAFRVGGMYRYAECDGAYILYSCMILKKESYMFTQFIPPAEALLRGDYSMETADGWTTIRIVACVGSIATSGGSWIPVFETNRPETLTLCKILPVYEGGAIAGAAAAVPSAPAAVPAAVPAIPESPPTKSILKKPTVQFSIPVAPVLAPVPAAVSVKKTVAKPQKTHTVIAVIDTDEADSVYETTQEKIARFKKMCASKPNGDKLLDTLGLGPDGAKCSVRK